MHTYTCMQVGAPSSASLPKEAAKASALPAAKKEGGAKKPSALDGGTGPFKEVPWMTPASLLAMCEPMYAQATQLTKAAEDLYTTFECRLTSAILAKVSIEPARSPAANSHGQPAVSERIHELNQ